MAKDVFHCLSLCGMSLMLTRVTVQLTLCSSPFLDCARTQRVVSPSQSTPCSQLRPTRRGRESRLFGCELRWEVNQPNLRWAVRPRGRVRPFRKDAWMLHPMSPSASQCHRDANSQIKAITSMFVPRGSQKTCRRWGAHSSSLRSMACPRSSSPSNCSSTA